MVWRENGSRKPQKYSNNYIYVGIFSLERLRYIFCRKFDNVFTIFCFFEGRLINIAFSMAFDNAYREHKSSLGGVIMFFVILEGIVLFLRGQSGGNPSHYDYQIAY